MTQLINFISQKKENNNNNNNNNFVQNRQSARNFWSDAV